MRYLFIVSVTYTIWVLTQYSSCMSKLGTCQPPPTVGNTPTMDKYLIQPHFKNPNYPCNTLQHLLFPPSYFLLPVGTGWSGSGQFWPGRYRHHRCQPGWWFLKWIGTSTGQTVLFFSVTKEQKGLFSRKMISCQQTKMPCLLCLQWWYCGTT